MIGPITDAVRLSRSTARWTVERRPWQQFGAGLPDELARLVAPPVVVTAELAVEPERGPDVLG
jgi:hypothetical protein